MAFAEAVVRRSEDVSQLRQPLISTLGPAAAAQTIATVAAFSGLVRVADGTGIPIDDGLAAASTDIREQLELGSYGGAANSADAVEIKAQAFTSIDALFS